ncbi:MAG: D-alanyl-D-alanine carboxypeptidase family protein [Acidimicrobiales bacterium]
MVSTSADETMGPNARGGSLAPPNRRRRAARLTAHLGASLLNAARQRIAVRFAMIVALLMVAGSLPSEAETTTTVAPPSESTTSETTTAPTSETTTSTAPTSTETAPAGGGSPTTTAAPTADQAQAERARLEAAQAAKAREVDAANGELSDLTSALRTLQERVDAQSGRVDYANEQLAAAEASVAATNDEVAAAEGEIAELEARVSDQAIRSFMGDDSDQVILANVPDPNEALRRQNLLAEATQTDLDLVGELRAAQEDLDVRRAEALDAVETAESIRTAAESELETLESDRAAQGQVTASAEARLDHLLSERSALAAIGEDSGGLPSETDLVDQLAAAPPPPSTYSPPTATSAGQIADAGKGIKVHVDIVDNVRRLLADAAAAGVDLGGGGYRSPDAQIATRRNNCGTSNYAIYQMPASQCRPPTARPGSSMHEQGKAIDFTYNGSLIRSRSGGGWAWLRDNAARYGLQNLPSEPWHWSVNGR